MKQHFLINNLFAAIDDAIHTF